MVYYHYFFEIINNFRFGKWKVDDFLLSAVQRLLSFFLYVQKIKYISIWSRSKIRIRCINYFLSLLSWKGESIIIWWFEGENPLTGKQGDVARGKLIIFILICKILLFNNELFRFVWCSLELSRILGSDLQILITS